MTFESLPISIGSFSGVEPARRDTEVDRLNKLYVEIISRNTDLSSCLMHLVKTESYRMLDGWSYSTNPEPIRFGTTSLDFPDQTDVRIIRNHYVPF